MEQKKISYEEELELSDILDRVLNKGVCITGDLIISIADIDLVYIGLRVLITSTDNLNDLENP